MALSTREREALLAQNLPASNEVRREIQDYMARTGLTTADLARRIGYSVPALNNFMRGAYAQISGSDAGIRKALLDFKTAHPVGGDEGSLPGKLYDTANVRLLRGYFKEALEQGIAYHVEGSPGTQKSFVLRRLVEELNARELMKNGHGRKAFYLYCWEGWTRTQAAREIARVCGAQATGDWTRIVKNLQFEFRNRRILLCLDECQHLSLEVLTMIRGLLDNPPHFGLLFAGNYEFGRVLTLNAARLEQWNRRFRAGKELPGLSDDEAAEIIRGELGPVKAAVVHSLIKGARAKAIALRTDKNPEGVHEYISAGRLFDALRELKTAREDDQAKGATA
jgi:DNA transposition AAA+ family ATPase